MRRSLLAVVTLLAVAVAAPARADVSGPDIVSFLNAQRTANGIPAGIVEDPTLSDGCVKHNNYGALNHVLIHDEDSTKPGYTAAGKQAAETSVLYAGGGPWTAARNPFETAPIHLHQLLAPRIDRMGAAETQGYGCATTLASRNRPAPPVDITYTYPGAGATGWVTAQTAAEGPYTPGEQLGIPAGTQTGPYLYVMFDGPDIAPWSSAHATAASLTGPSGPVDVAIADNTTNGLVNYLPPGMELIPRAPLATGTTYTAAVTADVTPGGGGPARAFSYTWSFTTSGIRDNKVKVTFAQALGRAVAISVTSDAPGAVVEATGPGATTSAAVGADGFARMVLPADGTWQVCARSGGGATGFTAVSDCTSVSVAAPPPIVGGGNGPGDGNRTTTGVAYTASAALKGHTVRVTVKCQAACRVRASGTVRRGGLKVTLPAKRATRSKAGTVAVALTIAKKQAARLARRSGKRVITIKLTVADAKGAGGKTKTLTLRSR
ncbi:Ig-like domain-containing protein [Baekduia sp. Peel2402]|uniref:Ig-like domain-containing protein n=1 Tax=Baekduia sp. Peel2402 TaxID=3458296 RepID=UPI00403EEBB6